MYLLLFAAVVVWKSPQLCLLSRRWQHSAFVISHTSSLTAGPHRELDKYFRIQTSVKHIMNLKRMCHARLSHKDYTSAGDLNVSHTDIFSVYWHCDIQFIIYSQIILQKYNPTWYFCRGDTKISGNTVLWVWPLFHPETNDVWPEEEKNRCLDVAKLQVAETSHL